jgi:hypothetical protein
MTIMLPYLIIIYILTYLVDYLLQPDYLFIIQTFSNKSLSKKMIAQIICSL